MKLPKELNVTEQMVNISDLTKKQSDYYQKLASELEAKYVELGMGRQIFSLSGPPGSGKSVVSAILNHLYTREAPFIFLNIGLDAFHFENSIIARRKLLDAKGRYDTYDTQKLFIKMKAFKDGSDVTFPYYSREIHNPIEDSLQVIKKNVLLLLEGQWLLRNKPDWEKIRKLFSLNLSVQGSIEDMRENVIRRHLTGGRTMKDSINFYTVNDLVNSEEIARNSIKPDIKVKFYKDI